MRTQTKVTSAVKTIGHITGTLMAEGTGLVAGGICRVADGVNKAPKDSFIGMRRDITIAKAYAKAKLEGYKFLEIDKGTPDVPTPANADS